MQIGVKDWRIKKPSLVVNGKFACILEASRRREGSVHIL